ncbi:MAG: hypothetical protein LBE76_07285 [Nitrososphaerota archaeon]|nr:hypothetical protein [Nitrososphaerota archaeon]
MKNQKFMTKPTTTSLKYFMTQSKIAANYRQKHNVGELGVTGGALN